MAHLLTADRTINIIDTPHSVNGARLEGEKPMAVRTISDRATTAVGILLRSPSGEEVVIRVEASAANYLQDEGITSVTLVS